MIRFTITILTLAAASVTATASTAPDTLKTVENPGTGLSVEELDDLMIHKAKLWLDSGKIFGESGRGFQRINVTCPRAVLKEAMDRMREALADIGK